jgi:hypothetical protein
MLKEVVSPSDESKLIDLVDAFPSFFALASHPMAVEVSAHAVQHLAAVLILLPLRRVEAQDILVDEFYAIGQQAVLVALEKVPNALVQLQADELRTAAGTASRGACRQRA